MRRQVTIRGMKFSVKTLLVVTLLLSLLINAGLKLSQLNDLKVQQTQLETQKRSLASQCYGYEARKAIFNRAFEAVQKRSEHFEIALEDFETLAEKKSQIKVADPSRAYIASIPTHSYRGFYHRFRVWLPDASSFQLQPGFSPEENTESPRSFDDSLFFEPASVNTISLPKGESVIGVRWIEERHVLNNTLRLEIDGQMTHELYSNHKLTSNHRHLNTVISNTPHDFFKTSFQKGNDKPEWFCLRLVEVKKESQGK